MIISQPALLCLTSLWSNLIGHATAREPQPVKARKPAAPPAAAIERAAAIREVRLAQATSLPVAQPEPLLARQEPPASPAPLQVEERSVVVPEVVVALSGVGPLTANERRARAAALRALAFSRARRFDAARIAFEDAATLDPLLDLTRVPSFWSLERAAHEAAIAAYTGANRPGDAAVLRAKVQSVYRPKPLRTRNVPVAT